MTDFEIAIDDAIATWYHNHQYEGDYFDNRRWDELYDEQKQIAARLFWEEKGCKDAGMSRLEEAICLADELC
tara:strand:- start:1087 stop:1302 length:216 start_codon:yes stop_codon:yes gene_type:complete